MTELRLVPKPEGFELRNKRSDKTGRGCDWEPQDALYDVSQEIAKPDVDCDAVLVIFRKRLDNGSVLTCTRFSGQPDAQAYLLLAATGKAMGWRPKDYD
jgi:hypothetical protein